MFDELSEEELGTEVLSPEQEPVLERYLQSLVLENPDVKAFMTGLAAFAAASFSSTETDVLCGVTVIRQKRAATVAGSDETAYALDVLQNGIGEGPCLAAMEEMRTMFVPDLREDTRWPKYTVAILGEGIYSVLGVPLLVEGETRACLNLYAAGANAFTGPDIERAESFAAQVSTSLQLALKISHLSEARDHMAAAMQSRTIIDLATGAIMAQNRCSQEAAMKILTTASSHRNIKLRELASSIVASLTTDPAVSTHFEE
ncbi:GAF and ANTAR domain-containing protein [bacterium RCC_150]